MSQTQYRANLSAKDFVFVSDNWGRTIIVKGFDQNFSRQIVSQTDPDKDIGIPQIFYCHNVMPSSQGFQSIGYQSYLAAVQNGMTDVIYMNDSANSSFGYLAFEPTGAGTVNVYGFTPGQDGGWIFVQNLPYNSGRPTVATVNGQSYFYLTVIGCWTYNSVTHTLTNTVLTGLTGGQIEGICESFGYMIAWSSLAVYWSSTVSPTDFTPSLITGAGGGQVQEVKGNIAFCFSHIFGFVIYSDKNAVAAVYSGNSRYPFNFRNIQGAGGCVDPALIGYDSESGNHYVWTTSGLQLVSVTQAQITFPELTNFLGGGRWEDFDETTNTFVEIVVATGSLSKRITVIANRYLVISYGPGTRNSFTHALVYDIGMKRWGKLRIDHVSCFELYGPSSLDDQQARRSIAFMATGGDTYVAYLDIDWTGTSGIGDANGVIILGKYQHTRNRVITIEQVDGESFLEPSKATCYILPTLDGKNFLPAVSPYVRQQSIQNSYNFRYSALNFSLLFKGRFALNSLVLSYHMNGRR